MKMKTKSSRQQTYMQNKSKKTQWDFKFTLTHVLWNTKCCPVLFSYFVHRTNMDSRRLYRFLGPSQGGADWLRRYGFGDGHPLGWKAGPSLGPNKRMARVDYQWPDEADRFSVTRGHEWHRGMFEEGDGECGEQINHIEHWDDNNMVWHPRTGRI